jgi:hypothetical protein
VHIRLDGFVQHRAKTALEEPDIPVRESRMPLWATAPQHVQNLGSDLLKTVT